MRGPAGRGRSQRAFDQRRRFPEHDREVLALLFRLQQVKKPISYLDPYLRHFPRFLGASGAEEFAQCQPRVKALSQGRMGRIGCVEGEGAA